MFLMKGKTTRDDDNATKKKKKGHGNDEEDAIGTVGAVKLTVRDYDAKMIKTRSLFWARW